MTGIAKLVGPDTHVLYTRGLPEMKDVFWRTHWEPGLKEATYPSKNFTGSPENASLRNINNYKQEWWGPADKTPRSIRYSASFKAPKAGKYLVLAAASGSDQYTVSVDGKQIIEQVQIEGQHPESASIDLNAGQTINVVADYLPGFVGNRFGLGIVNEADMISAEVKQYASVADVVVVAVGFNPSTESEGLDRTFTLPWGQDALIEAAVAANPHTVVTFIGGGAFDTRRWLDKVPALIHAWYPGQEGGTAIAAVLFGKHNPEGKLPISFDRTWEEDPSYAYYYPIKGADTRLHVIENNHPPVDLRHSSREVRRQADGRLPLLDHHRQASALPVWIRPQLYNVQLLESQSARDGNLGFNRAGQLRRDQHRQRPRVRKSRSYTCRILLQRPSGPNAN